MKRTAMVAQQAMATKGAQTATKQPTDILGSWAVPGLTALFLCAFCLAVAIGSVTVHITQVPAIISAKLTGQALPSQVTPAMGDILWELRIPRVILAAVVGAGLALSGTIMQASVQNPLAEPFILGIASGASAGAVLAILADYVLHMSLIPVPLAAFVGAIGATVAVLLLAGAVVSALCMAVANFIIYLAADAEGMQSAVFWSMGSLADAKWSGLLWPTAVVGGSALYFLSQVRALDVLLLGAEAAVTLGINATRKRYVYMTLVAIMTGVLVAQCGIIGFVGLVIPHMARQLIGTGHRRLLPVVMLGGATFLILADLLARIVLPAGDLPIGILTALLGAPLFMKLLFGNSGNFGG